MRALDIPCYVRSRQVVFDELGREKTLGSDSVYFGDIFGNPIDQSVIHDTDELLILGIGPFPSEIENILQIMSKSRTISWFECPDFERQMPQSWHDSIPKNWKNVSYEELKNYLGKKVYRYLPAQQVFSNFWGPIIAMFQVGLLTKKFGVQRSEQKTIVLPGNLASDLLTYELISACSTLGYKPIQYSSVPNQNMCTIFEDSLPSLFLSINLRGLDRDGYFFRQLQNRGIPVALWFVDNPWNILSWLRLPWWKEAHIFVTDISFVQSLKNHGAQNVYFLPLAAWNYQEPNTETRVSLKDHLYTVGFIGRSSFPNKDKFFSGHNLPNVGRKKALEYIQKGYFPHISWWSKKLGISTFWPSKDIRSAAFCAEYFSLIKKIVWISEAEKLGITVFGDDGWKQFLAPNADVRSPIDYYTTLPNSMKNIKYNLNVTSLLLPAGLTQRHFDTWVFDSFLITDNNPGLFIFPKDLVKYSVVKAYNTLYNHITMLEKDPTLRTTLMYAWKKHIRTFHTYTIRLEYILSTLHI